ncbi:MULTISPECIES: helix-turn-helix domain-containing protein [Paracoccus]|uniref:GlxA family transcriptional regulator n=1 Tax=Paracoccus TaxID=265 RepID=UPI001FB67033|nr:MULTISPECIES: helix-turn-helix domain-containing protein [Paracoccus]MCJ1902877.1 helix-turn-helix domain-containing protein [Paracoccus versutus]MDF3907408.1 helix-turn-helix domain-containing protein [Paracoccus sp. AS002]
MPYFLPMHQVAFILYPGFELLDISGPASVFNGANRALGQRGRPAFYKVVPLSAQGGAVDSSSGIALETRPIAELPGKAGTVLVVGAEREPLLQAMADPVLRSMLPRLTAEAGRFGSVCTGGFVLAASGLLDGHRVATHWDACEAFARTFPGVAVEPEALYLAEGRLWTSAGVTTGIDMALAMVAHDLDAGIAGEVAKRLVLYARRPGYQSQFSPLLRAQARGDNPFGDLIGWMQANLDTPLDVPSLAARTGLSERSFHRKFTAATGETPARFVETARLDAARMLLSRGLPLKTVAAQVGLSPAPRFAQAFERRFGITPRLFRDMHMDPPAAADTVG